MCVCVCVCVMARGSGRGNVIMFMGNVYNVCREEQSCSSTELKHADKTAAGCWTLLEDEHGVTRAIECEQCVKGAGLFDASNV